MNPRYTVAIPTRNRAQPLPYAMRTILAQTFGDFELLICDDASEDDTARVVAGFVDARIRYVRAPEPQGIGGIFDFAINQARGQFVIFIGDDDGLMPDALEKIEEAVSTHGAEVVRWHRAQYNWPNYPFPEERNRIYYTRPRYAAGFRESSELIDEAVRYVDCNGAPGLVNCAIRRDVFDRIKSAAGRHILSYAADTSSSFAILCVTRRIYCLSEVIAVTGVSAFSHGTLLFKKEGGDIEREFVRLSRARGYKFTYWEMLGSSIPAIVLDSMHNVAEFFPGRIPTDRADLPRAAAQSLIEYRLVSDPGRRRELNARVFSALWRQLGIRGVCAGIASYLSGQISCLLARPSLRPIGDLIRFLLGKPYSSREVIFGHECGVSDILGACAYLYEIRRSGER